MPNRSRLVFALAVVLVALATGAAALFLQTKRDSGSGTALVGGPFSLTDQYGRRVTEKDFAGKYMLVFFGYTSCPDICPAGLQVMTSALEEMGAEAGDITPVFITIDPARDTQALIKEYAANFHPRLVALTGTDAEIAAAAKAYRIYYAKPKGEDGKAGYLMDHSTITYLMNPDGSFATHIAYGTSAADMAAKIRSARGAKQGG
jgi:cytochrome oxidase Cu insertion factor (SCO1/SenC/PrrC family)